METSISIESGDMALVIAFVLLLGGIIKNFTPVNNKWIPLITWLLGGLLYQWLAGGWTDPRQWMMALISVAGATGLHAATRSTLAENRPEWPEGPNPPSASRLPLLLMIVGLVGIGAGCVTSQRLESGGAYASTATQAALPELFLTDATFDVAYAALDVPFKTERANRALFWSISPEIKHGLDKLREQANQVNRDYALGRTAYLANPEPANLAPLHAAIARLNACSTAALVIIQTKGKQ